MIEILVIIAAIAVLILTPIEVNKIKTGWVRKSFKGTPAEFVTAYRKQLLIMIWFGGVMGLAYVGLGFLAEREDSDIAKFVIAALWLAVGAMSYFMREKLASVAPPLPPPGAS
jgi:hypothetical protein